MSNIKVRLGNILKELGVLKFTLNFVAKFGYLTRFANEHSSGIDLSYDIKSQTNLGDIKTVFDVGASIGSMTNVFLKTFPNSKIYAFEPYNVSFEILKTAFKNNNSVIPVNQGLSNKNFQTEMFIKSDSGYNSISEQSNIPDDKNKGLSQIIDVTTIDYYCEQNNITSIDFIKIDTEGLEIFVLQGADKLLRAKKIKYIYAECSFDKDNIQNTYFEYLYEYLKPYGYKIRAIYDQSTFGQTSYISCVNALFLLHE